MGFDKDYPNRKDHRKPYRGSKRFDRSCRNHGNCPYCENGRQHNHQKAKEYAEEQLKEWKEINIMSYPTLEQVEVANRTQICRWHRFLNSPETTEQVEINNFIVKRFKELGGFTPEISKQVGWDEIGTNRT